MITVLRRKDKKVRKTKLPELTVNMWLNAYREAQAEIEEPVPDGFVFIEEVMEVFGLCRSKTFCIIKKLEAAGKVERRKIRRVKSNGKIKLVGVYKILSK